MNTACDSTLLFRTSHFYCCSYVVDFVMVIYGFFTLCTHDSEHKNLTCRIAVMLFILILDQHSSTFEYWIGFVPVM